MFAEEAGRTKQSADIVTNKSDTDHVLPFHICANRNSRKADKTQFHSYTVHLYKKMAMDEI